MAVNPDFRELFSALNAAEARYLVVGAYAVRELLRFRQYRPGR